MGKLLRTSFLLLLVAFLVPVLISKPIKETAHAIVPATPPVSLSSAANKQASPDSQTILLFHSNKVVNIPLSDYLVGVVAAEMPASFNLEALKAQAVASRTYAIYNMKQNKHKGFNVCDDYSCCSAYADLDTLHDKWGANFNTYYDKIKSAVLSTDGQYLSWNGEPILAAFHSSSYGSTESSENVWSTPMPYLKSVKTPETPDKVTNLITTVTVSESNFKETISKKYPRALFGPDINLWITSLSYDENGRVTNLNVGGVQMTGAEIRQLFNLRSTAFSYRVLNGAVIFTVSGYGHGVGMSQYGANIMANNGAAYDKILMTYYTGVQILKLT